MSQCEEIASESLDQPILSRACPVFREIQVLVNQFMSVIISNNDSETDIGEYHAAVDLECLETFHKGETVP